MALQKQVTQSVVDGWLKQMGHQLAVTQQQMMADKLMADYKMLQQQEIEKTKGRWPVWEEYVPGPDFIPPFVEQMEAKAREREREARSRQELINLLVDASEEICEAWLMDKQPGDQLKRDFIDLIGEVLNAKLRVR